MLSIDIYYFRQQGAESETESVRNMRIVAAMARLSRVHVVSLQGEGAPLCVCTVRSAWSDAHDQVR